jgi:adenine-specific DNA-methyltransferase
MSSSVSVALDQAARDRSEPFYPERRRSLGIYYTPAGLSDAIAYWAVRNKKDTVLEPSFGGCAFLVAARRQLVALKARKPGSQLAGCDVDQSAFSILHSIAGKRPSTSRYLKKDFLSVEPSNFPINEFTCVLGNPPFVRHHAISRSVKRNIAKLALRTAKPLPRTAGLWAHFVSHGLRFLGPNGRIGLVLPGSFLFADYARPLRDSIRRDFSRTTVVKLNYQTWLYEGAEERAVVLLAEGFGSGSCSDWIEVTAESEDLAKTAIRSARAARPKTYRASIVRPQSNRVYDDLAKADCARTLGEIAKVDIGVVTGDNKFFILPKAKAETEGLSKSLFTQIIARARHTTGLHMQSEEFEALQNSQASCLLLTPDNISERHSNLRRYLATMSRAQRKSGVWLNKRARWYCPDVGIFPDAALTYMNHRGPRLILLDGKTTCSNTLHRIWLPFLDTTRRKLVALSLLSSFSQLSAELVGRSYGGGVLKIEPSDARRISLIIPDRVSIPSVNRLFEQADSALKLGHYDQACDIADGLILQPLLGDYFLAAIAALKSDLQEKRVQRHTRRATREQQP